MKSTNTDKHSLRSSSKTAGLKHSLRFSQPMADAGLKVATEVANVLLDVGAITFRPRQPFRYASGIVSPIYTDNRLILSYPSQRNKIVKYLVEKVKKIGIPDVIAGVATAAIPHAAFVAQKLNLPMVYVRAKPKDYGTGSQIEGIIKRGQRAVVIEDLPTTGRSSIQVIDALRKIGAQITDEVAIFSYGLGESEKNFSKAQVKLHALSNLEHSVKAAKDRGFLSDEQIKTILAWAKDPHNWAKKMGFE